MQQRRAVRERSLHVQHRWQVLVVDEHQLARVPGRRGVPRDDHGHALAGEVHGVDGERRALRRLLVGHDRPRAGQGDLFGAEVPGGEDAKDAGQAAGLVGVDAGDPGVRHGRADHGHVQQPGQGDVVGPAGAPGDEAGVLLAGA